MIYLFYPLICVFSFLGIRKLMVLLFPNSTKSTNTASGVLAIALTPKITTSIIVLILGITMYEYHPDRSFDKSSWQENVIDRFEMGKDLVKSKMLIQKTKSQIVDEIGLPSENFNLEQDTLSNWRFIMGSRGWGFGIKFYYLDVSFEDGQSKNVTIEENID